MTFSEIKPRIKNLGNFSSLKEIKEVGLRICRNTKTGDCWLIEGEFLKPVIKSPRECKSILIKPEDLKYKLFMCHKSKQELKNTKALEYIEWGEKQKSKDNICWNEVPSVSGRKRWHDLGERKPALLNFNYLIDKYGVTFYAPVFVSDNFHQIYTHQNIDLFMNSTLFWLFENILGRKSFGGGLLKVQTYELEETFVMPMGGNKLRKALYEREIKPIFQELGFDKNKPIRSQQPKPLPDRAELDKIVFDELGLTEQERKEVYWAVAELVKNRLDKAGSFNAK